MVTSPLERRGRYEAPLDRTVWTEAEVGALKSDYNDVVDGLANLAGYLVTNHYLYEWPLWWFPPLNR